MPSLSKLQEIVDGKSFDSDSGFVAKYGKTQDFVLRNFNTGVARFFGLPRTATDLLEAGENKLLDLVGIDPDKLRLSRYIGDGERGEGFLPSSEDIQNLGAKAGLTYRAGEEPDTLGARIIQNIGTTGPLLPFLGPAALAPELIAATTGAIGGKIVQQTDFGRKHPELARAIGELGGGLSPVGARVLFNFYSKGGFVRSAIGLGKKGVQKGKGLLPKTKERVEARLRSITPSPGKARTELAREAVSPEGKFLKPGQASGDPGIASLSRGVELASPEFAEQMALRRIRQHKVLERQFKGKGKVTVADAREFIEGELITRANRANIALSKVGTAKNPAALSESAENIIRGGLTKARVAETKAWNSLPSGELAKGTNLTRVIKKELKSITEGGTIDEISSFAREKLGRFIVNKKTGKSNFIGGTLFNKKKPDAPAKAIHQFYSQLGRERATLARQGGTANKIRIIDDLREAAMKDLDVAGLSAPYTDAIKLSRDLNQTFNKGAMGRITGLGRGEAVSPTKTLDELIGKGGQSGKESIQQALRGAPETKKGIEDFIKTQFALTAVGKDSNLVNAVNGNRFLKDYDEILTDIFPSLKAELQDAIRRQVNVDEFIGVPQTSQLSPLIKEKSAASIFLKANPGEEMGKIINSTSIQRAEVLTDLVKLAKRDTSGRALEGLKHGFAEEIFEYARKGDVIKGKLILEKIGKLRPALLKSGLFDKDEIARFNRIGDAFEKIAFEVSQKGIAIIDDLPSFFQTNMLKILAVRTVGFVKKKLSIGSSFGTSLQEAGLASGAASRFSKSLTNDEARNLLIRAVKDRDLMDTLLKDISKVSATQKQTVFNKVTEKLNELRGITPSQALSKAGEIGGKIIERAAVQRPRAGAIVPPAASLGEISSGEERREATPEQIQELRNLKALIRQRR